MKTQFNRVVVIRAAIAASLAITAGMSVDSFASGSSSANLAVSANVADNCAISTSPVNFGTFDTLSGSPLDGNGKVTVTCTNGASASVSLGEGLNAGSGSTASAPLRQMKYTDVGGDHMLSYNLYTANDFGTVWGDAGVAATADGGAHDINVYGRIDGGQQTAVKGTYSDTVSAVVNF